MFGKLSAALTRAPVKPAADHNAASRVELYTEIASELASANVPVSWSDCSACDDPCDIRASDSYPQYVMERYGDLGELPAGFDTDWETELAGSAAGGRGRVIVISTGKSDWERDHFDEADTLPHHLHNHVQSLKLPVPNPRAKDFSKRPPVSEYILAPAPHPPSLYSSSLISQSHDGETALVFPDWTVVQEVQNSPQGAATLYTSLDGGPAERQISHVMPYRAVILLCSHKRRDKRCHIAAPLLRSALHVVLAKHSISIDETGSSLSHLDEPLEDAADREAEISKRKGMIERDGGEVGIFNINHLGGHRYAGVMLILFPSGTYISYGRVTPQEIPRVVEETILEEKIVPGLLRNAVGSW